MVTELLHKLHIFKKLCFLDTEIPTIVNIMDKKICEQRSCSRQFTLFSCIDENNGFIT